MNRIILIISLFLYFSHISLAQVENISEHFFEGPNLTEGFNTIAASDGGYLILGAKSFLNADNSGDQWIVKLDDNQEMEWEYFVNGPITNNSFYDFAMSGIEVTDGYIVLGVSNNFPTDIATLTKLDDDGNLLWQILLEDLNIAYSAFSSILSVNENEFVIAGFQGPDFNDLLPSLIKFDINGNVIWDKTYSNFNTIPPSLFYGDLAMTADGGFLMANSLHDVSHITKLDANGALIWTTNLDTPGGCRSVQVQDDGNILVLTTKTFSTNPSLDYLFQLDEQGNILNSHLFDHDLVEATVDATLDNNGDLYIAGNDFTDDTGLLLKTNALGDTLWTHTFYPPNSLEGIFFSSIELIDDNHLLLSGGGLRTFNSSLLVVNSMYLAVVTLEGEVVSTYAIKKPADSNQVDFNTFPNPAVDVVNFSTSTPTNEQWQVQLFDLSGKLVTQKSVQQNDFELNRNGLASGTYIYKISTKNKGLVDVGRVIFK